MGTTLMSVLAAVYDGRCEALTLQLLRLHLAQSIKVRCERAPNDQRATRNASLLDEQFGTLLCCLKLLREGLLQANAKARSIRGRETAGVLDVVGHSMSSNGQDDLRKNRRLSSGMAARATKGRSDGVLEVYSGTEGNLQNNCSRKQIP